jgi:hypothetical protein
MFAREMSSFRLAARALLVALVAALLSAPTSALAQDADALIKQGVELRRAGKDQAALEQFRRAYDLAPTPRALAQMGLAEQALGRWIDGDAHLGKALQSAQDPWIAKYLETLERSRAEIDKHLGSLSLSGGPEGAEVRLDGQLVGALPLRQTLRLPVGSFTLDVSASGHVLLTRAVGIAPGSTTHEDLSAPAAGVGGASPSLAPASPARDAPPRDVGASSSGQRTLAWISAGGALGFTLGGFVALHERNKDAEQYNACLMSCEATHQSGVRAQTWEVASFVLAGALGATAAVLFLTARESGPGAEGRVACLPDLGRVGATCALRF